MSILEIHLPGEKATVLVVNFFRIFLIKLFCFVVAICELVHDVEPIHGLC